MERLKKREREKFGERIAPGGDIEWQKLLQCPQIVLDGAGNLEENFRVVKEEILK